MLSKIFSFLKKQNYSQLYTEDLNWLVKGYAITIFLDNKIEFIEIVTTDKIISKYIEETYPDLNEKEADALKKLAHDDLLKILISFKNDNNVFQKAKNDFYLFLSKNQSNTLIHDIKKIIDSDNILAEEEKEFYNKIIKI